MLEKAKRVRTRERISKEHKDEDSEGAVAPVDTESGISGGCGRVSFGEFVVFPLLLLFSF
jgi:hypothetical protein